MTTTEPDMQALRKDLEARVATGDRFAGLFATRTADHDPVVLSAHVATVGDIETLQVTLPQGATSYPALTPRIGAAFWYERVIHDQLGLVPEGHPRLAALIRPGDPLPRHVEGCCAACATAWSPRAGPPGRTLTPTPGAGPPVLSTPPIPAAPLP